MSSSDWQIQFRLRFQNFFVLSGLWCNCWQRSDYGRTVVCSRCECDQDPDIWLISTPPHCVEDFPSNLTNGCTGWVLVVQGNKVFRLSMAVVTHHKLHTGTGSCSCEWGKCAGTYLNPLNPRLGTVWSSITPKTQIPAVLKKEAGLYLQCGRREKAALYCCTNQKDLQGNSTMIHTADKRTLQEAVPDDCSQRIIPSVYGNW